MSQNQPPAQRSGSPLPDFLVIGGIKCGTTALHQYLSQHAEIFMPALKELQFFSAKQAFERGSAHYSSFFADAAASGASRLGEASPGYLLSPEAPRRVANLLPEVRLIALLRDPVDRAYSHYWQLVRRQVEHRSIEAVIADHVSGKETSPVVEEGLYGAGLERWFACHQPEHILVLASRDLDANREQTLATIARFLCISDRPGAFGDVTERHHVSTDARLPVLNAALGRLPPHLRRTAKQLLGPATMMRIKRSLMVWNRRPARSRPPMPAFSRAMLEDYYRESNRHVAVLLGGLPWESKERETG